jgi:hypothetical protein
VCPYPVQTREGRDVMKPDELASATWRKSSYSGGAGSNCVLVAMTEETVGIRDSKQGDHGTVLLLSKGAWQEFTRALKVLGG